MANKKPAAQKPNKIKGFWKIGLMALVAMVVIGVVLYFAKAWYQGYKFRQVETKMDKLQTSFVEALGKPIYQSKEESCGHSSVVYGRGRLSCGFKSASYYALEDVGIARSYINKVQSIARRSNIVDVTYEHKPDLSYDGSSRANTSPPANDFIVNNKSTCSGEYLLVNTKVSDTDLPREVTDIKSPYYLVIGTSCLTYPLRPLFPVKAG